MAGDTVRVQFSASIGALIKGVEDAKSAIESVRASTDQITGALDQPANDNGAPLAMVG